MKNNLERLIEILSELRSDSMKATEDTARDLMEQYNLLFLGSNFNTVYSSELPQSFKSFFDFDIDINKLNELIPIACKSLNMDIVPLINHCDSDNPKAEISCYCITLW